MHNNIAFSGLGRMEMRMVKNILQHQYQVAVVDIMLNATQSLVQYAAFAAGS